MIKITRQKKRSMRSKTVVVANNQERGGKEENCVTKDGCGRWP